MDSHPYQISRRPTSRGRRRKALSATDDADNLVLDDEIPTHIRAGAAKTKRSRRPLRRFSDQTDPQVIWTLRLPRSLDARLKAWAEQERRSKTGQLVWLLQRALYEREHGAMAPTAEAADYSKPSE